MTHSKQAAVSVVLSALLGMYVVVGATISLVGWQWNLERLTDWNGIGISIKPNAAIAAGCGGIALLIFAVHRSREIKVSVALLSGLMMLIGAATLFEHITALNFGIDTLLFDEPEGELGTASPGRMGVPASLSFTLLGLAFLQASFSRRFRAVGSVAACIVVCIAIFSLIAYLFGAEAIYSDKRLTAVAVQTASMLLALSVGFIVAFPEQEPMRLLCEDSGAGLFARRALPLLLILPPALGWARGQGELLYLYDRPTGRALLIVLLMILLTGLIWRALLAVRARERALSEADESKNQFMAMLAHELRNPLAPVVYSLEVMKQADESPEAIRQSRLTIERHVRQMSRLIEDLLDVSRIGTNKIELRKQRIELAPVLRQALEACHPLAETAGHVVKFDIPPEPIHLEADPVRLTQIFGNILNNACKYMRGGGQVDVTTYCDGNHVEVKVVDTGIGIPPEMLPKVFDMFTQVDQSLERSQGGLGIGLSLVKRLVELHNGQVAVDSPGLGRGTTFIVRLPVLSDSKVEIPLPPQREPTVVAERVLIVDDNKDSATTLAMLMKINGCDARTAYDGLTAVEMTAEYNPDVILLDISLPKMNGYDVCRTLRAKPGGKEIVMIALTGWGHEEDRQNSLDAGFNGHMVKPINFPALLELLADLKPAGAAKTVATRGVAVD